LVTNDEPTDDFLNLWPLKWRSIGIYLQAK
jgi:hypothetical protein